ncbi:hypothetical protein H4R35_003779 [Dimargaris xerosporica]|nr:hypothetical protein H4R35_003779 [Dimargaris xerosporica]
MPAQSHNGDVSLHVVKHEIKAKTHSGHRITIHTVTMDNDSALAKAFLDTQCRWEQSAHGMFCNGMDFLWNKMPRCPVEPGYHLLLCLIYHSDCKIICLSASPRTQPGVAVVQDIGTNHARHADVFICMVARTSVIRDCLMDWFQLAWRV